MKKPLSALLILWFSLLPFSAWAGVFTLGGDYTSAAAANGACYTAKDSYTGESSCGNQGWPSPCNIPSGGGVYGFYLSNGNDGVCFRYSSTCPAGKVADSTGFCHVACSSGTTWSETTKTCVSSCPEGSTWNSTTSTCDPVCTAGESASTQSSMFYDGTSSDMLCIGSCQASYGDSVCGGGKCTVWGPFIKTGSTCSASDKTPGGGAGPDPDTVASCADQGLGSITLNGVTTCTQPTDSNPVVTTRKSTTDGTTSSRTTTSTGEQIIVTETTGGTSTTTSSSVSEFCRTNPSASMCVDRVRIDEGGTSTTWAGSQAAQDAVDGVAAEFVTSLNDSTGIDVLPWEFSFSFPSGACHPVEWSVLGQLKTFDPCPLLERVRSALAFLLYAMAGIYIWKRSTGAVGGA